MSDYFDHLERALRVAARERRHRAWHLRFLSRLHSRRMLVVASAPLLLGAGAAAAVIATRTTESPAQTLMNRVLQGTEHTKACSIVSVHHAVLDDRAPERAITAALPWLATVPPSAPPAATLRLAEDNGGVILVHTIRGVQLQHGIRLLMFVSTGDGPVEAFNPGGCVTARLAALNAIRPQPTAAVRARATRLIKTLLATEPGVESLTLEIRSDGPPAYSYGGGTSIPIPPGGTVPSGVVDEAGPNCVHSDTRHNRCTPPLFIGIASPGAALVRVSPARRSEPRPLNRVVPVVDGVFAYTLPLGAGPVTITQETASGKTLAVQPGPGGGAAARS
jgi:hypothetical protein